MKSVLIISSSPRKGGNSDILCDRFFQGAQDSGNRVEKIRSAEKNIAYCMGCNFCLGKGACSQKDDMGEIAAKINAADVIVLATPVYFYTMCAQMKTFIDRCCAYYTGFKNKEFYYIVTAADENESAMEKTVEGFRGFTLDCIEGAEEKGIIYGPGVYGAGEIKSNKAYKEAYELGKNV